jgi:hypothetical protein
MENCQHCIGVPLTGVLLAGWQSYLRIIKFIGLGIKRIRQGLLHISDRANRINLGVVRIVKP